MSKIISQTSRAAYLALNPIRIHQTHIAIVKALESIGKGNYESISEYMKVPEQRVWKRLNEAVKLGLIHNTGETTRTKSGFKSYLYAAGKSTEEVEKKKRVMKGPTVQQFAKAINQKQMSDNTINRLF